MILISSLWSSTTLFNHSISSPFPVFNTNTVSKGVRIFFQSEETVPNKGFWSRSLSFRPERSLVLRERAHSGLNCWIIGWSLPSRGRTPSWMIKSRSVLGPVVWIWAMAKLNLYLLIIFLFYFFQIRVAPGKDQVKPDFKNWE